ncbi:hypothetical protein GLAREA_08794 [Glarea lozoyensis ATCC 20868]|uniref:2EXR domain-containing protein n=1 Tax=Glarea lozoyensis (strain ATCC 20868 / MF5171) TaxID=1116229 RepID=S3DXG1_GLAL2|nr:uncharacterized protein GLAREA_08794 [Glarea lozoyensis ATCC 20868]EPE36631.1 hypothetical protein GLAREA_08794 [Glarea lozoyensis ATCC 20868]
MSLLTPKLDDFPQFKRLPPEVRAMIWRAAILPRIVFVQLDGIFTLQNIRGSLNEPYQDLRDFPMGTPPFSALRYDNPDFLYGYSGNWIPVPDYILSSKSTVPLLNTCRESRVIVKPIYSKLYIDGKPSHRHREQPVFFDFAQDTLYIESSFYTYWDWPVLYRIRSEHYLGRELEELRPIKCIGTENANKIHRLAINFPSIPNHETINEIFQTFKNLQKLTIVNPAHHQNPRDLVQTGGIYNITDSLRIFELEESRFFENMELQRLAYEQEHCEKFNEDSPHEDDLKSIWKKIYDTPAPSISYETVTTRMRWEAYKEARKRYDIRRDLYECSLQNESVEHKFISQWLQEGAVERRYLRD